MKKELGGSRLANREKGAYWLTQAARQGDAQAAACLGEWTL